MKTFTVLTLILFGLVLAACAPAPVGPVSGGITPEPAIPSWETQVSATALTATRAAVQALATELGIEPAMVAVISVEAVDWTDSCVGAGGPAESCALVITPGYRIVMEADEQQYIYHTNVDGTVARPAPQSQAETEPDESTSNVGPALVYRRVGGIAGFCDDLAVARTGDAVLLPCEGAPEQPPRTETLTDAETTKLNEWLDALAPFSVATSDGNVPDSLTVELEFSGQGTRAATEAEKAAVAQFAQHVLARWSTPAEGTEQPTPPSDQQFAYGLAPVDSVELQVPDESPLSVLVIARGNLPDGCTSIDEATWAQESNTFFVTITTVRPTDAMCTQALVPFEETVFVEPPDPVEPGTYRVEVNGVAEEFTIPAH